MKHEPTEESCDYYMIWSTDIERDTHDHPSYEQESYTLEANELSVYLFKQAFGRDINSDVIKAEPEPQEQE